MAGSSRKTSGSVAAWGVMSLVLFGMGWVGSAWLRAQTPPSVTILESGPSSGTNRASEARGKDGPREDSMELKPEGLAVTPLDSANTATREELAKAGLSQERAELLLQARIKAQGFPSWEALLTAFQPSPEEIRALRSLSPVRPDRDADRE